MLHFKLEVGDVVGRSHVEIELIIKEIGLQRWELVLRDDEKNLKLPRAENGMLGQTGILTE